MSEPIQACPLQWPPGWPRKSPNERTSAKFRNGTGGWADSRYKAAERVSVTGGIERVLLELDRMGFGRDDVVISTNIPTRLDGLPRGDARSPSDPGVSVYWHRRRGRSIHTRCMAIDRYDRVADNLAAIAATLEAMRAIERHGGAEILDRAFTGFAALAAPEQWFQVLGVPVSASQQEIETAYRRLAMTHHPDRPDGDGSQMARINTARDEGLRGGQ